MEKIGKTEIEQAVSAGGLAGYTGEYRELGGGELNDTFLLTCTPDPVVLRVSKYTDQNGLPREAKALALLNSNHVPKLIYFDIESRILGRRWILESYIPGTTVPRLSQKQFASLGSLLAQVHAVKATEGKLDIWGVFIDSCKRFGDEQFLLSHPDTRLQALVRKAQVAFVEAQPAYDHIQMSLVHGDATPSNVLTIGEEVALIDWEMSSYNDPMAEFATIYYDDIEYNEGKWRIQITPEERAALFSGYAAAGGSIDEDRIRLWMNHDKLGAACFLYWRIHHSGRDAEPHQIAQYERDLANLTASLERNL